MLLILLPVIHYFKPCFIDPPYICLLDTLVGIYTSREVGGSDTVLIMSFTWYCQFFFPICSPIVYKTSYFPIFLPVLLKSLPTLWYKTISHHSFIYKVSSGLNAFLITYWPFGFSHLWIHILCPSFPSWVGCLFSYWFGRTLCISLNHMRLPFLWVKRYWILAISYR